MSEFGFTVARHIKWNRPGDPVSRIKTDKWHVYLPHQCDEWDIAGEESYGEGASHEDAIKALEQFIAEAQQALCALKLEEELDDE